MKLPIMGYYRIKFNNNITSLTLPILFLLLVSKEGIYLSKRQFFKTANSKPSITFLPTNDRVGSGVFRHHAERHPLLSLHPGHWFMFSAPCCIQNQCRRNSVRLWHIGGLLLIDDHSDAAVTLQGGISARPLFTKHSRAQLHRSIRIRSFISITSSLAQHRLITTLLARGRCLGNY